MTLITEHFDEGVSFDDVGSAVYGEGDIYLTYTGPPIVLDAAALTVNDVANRVSGVVSAELIIGGGFLSWSSPGAHKAEDGVGYTDRSITIYPWQGGPDQPVYEQWWFRVTELSVVADGGGGLGLGSALGEASANTFVGCAGYDDGSAASAPGVTIPTGVPYYQPLDSWAVPLEVPFWMFYDSNDGGMSNFALYAGADDPAVPSSTPIFSKTEASNNIGYFIASPSLVDGEFAMPQFTLKIADFNYTIAGSSSPTASIPTTVQASPGSSGALSIG